MEAERIPKKHNSSNTTVNNFFVTFLDFGSMSTLAIFAVIFYSSTQAASNITAQADSSDIPIQSASPTSCSFGELLLYVCSCYRKGWVKRLIKVSATCPRDKGYVYLIMTQLPQSIGNDIIFVAVKNFALHICYAKKS